MGVFRVERTSEGSQNGTAPDDQSELSDSVEILLKRGVNPTVVRNMSVKNVNAAAGRR